MKWVNESTWKHPSTVVVEPKWQSCGHESRHRDVPCLGAWATVVIKSWISTWKTIVNMTQNGQGTEHESIWPERKNWAEHSRNQCRKTCFHKWQSMTLNRVNKHYCAMKLQYKHISKLKLKIINAWKLLSMSSERKCIQDFDGGTLRWNEVNKCLFSPSMGGLVARKEKKLLSMRCNIDRLCWKSIRGSVLIHYLSIGQWATIDNEEWWGSYHNNSQSSVSYRHERMEWP